jgi:hypothetical protein
MDFRQKRNMSALTIKRTLLVVVLLGAVVATQMAYDATRIAGDASLPGTVSPEAVRLFDMGFHAAAGSFLWIGTLPEILDLFHKKTEYINDVAYVNAVDPKLSYPYAFSVIALPAVPTTFFSEAVTSSLMIGERGLANADPDWRIPYYLATNYFLDRHDKVSAAKYFDIAAKTPGIPSYAKQFAENFGIDKTERAQTRELWQTIRDTTNDQDTKARAQAYIDRVDIFDYLEAAVAQYKKVFKKLPTSLDDVVTSHIIPEIPQDPFGYTFTLHQDGTVAIDASQ